MFAKAHVDLAFWVSVSTRTVLEELEQDSSHSFQLSSHLSAAKVLLIADGACNVYTHSVSGHMSCSTYCCAVVRTSGKARVYVLFYKLTYIAVR